MFAEIEMFIEKLIVKDTPVAQDPLVHYEIGDAGDLEIHIPFIENTDSEDYEDYDMVSCFTCLD